jgi:tRNA nucleotidyltransferase/poly(A) polymerase
LAKRRGGNVKSFKKFLESKIENSEQTENKDWKKEFIKLEKGFVPPSNMKPIIKAFEESSDISLMKDTSKEIKMPRKSLYLTGGSVRDFLRNKTPKNYNLATDATPKQVSIILKNYGFSQDNDKKSFTIEGSNVIVNVEGDEFQISTLMKGDQYTDNIEHDSQRRDLTINSLYIELSKSDGENNKLYDPTKKGWYDIVHGNIKSIGNPETKFREDKLRMMRTIRFYSQYGKGELDKDIKKAIAELRSEVDSLPYEKIREEFLKGLTNPDIDPRKYLENYSKVGLLEKIFKNVSLNLDVPPDFSNKKDKILALAWILQDNPIDEVENVLSNWTSQEKCAVVCLLKLKDFNLDNLEDLLASKKISGLSEEQIRNWVELFNVEGRSLKPKWTKMVKAFAKFVPNREELVGWNSAELSNSHPFARNQLIKTINKEKIKEMFKKQLE